MKESRFGWDENPPCRIQDSPLSSSAQIFLPMIGPPPQVFPRFLGRQAAL